MHRIYTINILIFIGYYIVGLLLAKSGSNNSGAGAIMFLYIIHAAILFLIGIINGIRGAYTKQKTDWGHYILAGALLLLIGFGVCTLTVFSGLNILEL